MTVHITQFFSNGEEMRILIAEDDNITRKIILRILSEYGECTSVPGGEEALELFSKSIVEKNRYDLICLDLMMPKMNGIDTLHEIRKLEKAHKGTLSSP